MLIEIAYRGNGHLHRKPCILLCPASLIPDTTLPFFIDEQIIGCPMGDLISVSETFGMSELAVKSLLMGQSFFIGKCTAILNNKRIARDRDSIHGFRPSRATRNRRYAGIPPWCDRVKKQLLIINAAIKGDCLFSHSS